MAKMENLRFGVKVMAGQTVLDNDQVSLYIKGEFNGETYGNYVLFEFEKGKRLEVPAGAFERAVRDLLEGMQDAEEYLIEQERSCHKDRGGGDA